MAKIKIGDLNEMLPVSPQDAELVKGGPLEIRELNIKVVVNDSK